MYEIIGSFEPLKSVILQQRTLCKEHLRTANTAVKTAKGTALRIMLTRNLINLRYVHKQLSIPVTKLLPVRVQGADEDYFFNGVLLERFMKKLKPTHVHLALDNCTGQLQIMYTTKQTKGKLTLNRIVIYGSIFQEYEKLIPELKINTSEVHYK